MPIEYTATIIGDDQKQVDAIYNAIVSDPQSGLATNARIKLFKVKSADDAKSINVKVGIEREQTRWVVLDAKRDVKAQAGEMKKLGLRPINPCHVILINYDEKNPTNTQEIDVALKDIGNTVNVPVYDVTSITKTKEDEGYEDLRKKVKGDEKSFDGSYVYLLVRNFKKIYQALRDGQTSWTYKSNYLDDINRVMVDDSAIRSIEAHVKKTHPESRTAKAWELAKRYIHSQDISTDVALFKEIYAYAFSHSGWFFKRSQSTGTTFFATSSLQGNLADLKFEDNPNPNSRTAKIRRALESN